MQCRINRALRQIERAGAPLLDGLDDGVAMRRSRLERRQHDGIEVPFEHFRFHT